MKRLITRVVTGASVVVGCCLMQGCVRDGDKTETVGKEPVIIPEIKEDVVTPPPTRPPVINQVATTTPYTVKSGDTITGIAAHYGLRWQDVVAVNPGISPNTIRPGQVIQLPGQVDVSKTVASRTPPKVAAPTREETVYVVKSGDTLGEIALKHQVKTADILKANPDLKDANKLSVNQKLKIPGATKSVANVGTARQTPPKIQPPTGTKPPVKTGDDVKQPERESVGLKPPPPVNTNEVKGAGIAVGSNADPVPPPTSNRLKHTVRAGEDLYSVAIRWGVSPSDLRLQNKLPSNEVKEGMVLEIPDGPQ